MSSEGKSFEPSESSTLPSSPGALTGFQRCPRCGQKDPSGFKAQYAVGETVYVEGKSGECKVAEVHQVMPGIFRYTLTRTETFMAHEQYLTRKPQ